MGVQCLNIFENIQKIPNSKSLLWSSLIALAIVHTLKCKLLLILVDFWLNVNQLNVGNFVCKMSA